MTARPARFHSAGSDERRGMSVAQVREVYLDVADAAAQLLAAPEVAAREISSRVLWRSGVESGLCEESGE